MVSLNRLELEAGVVRTRFDLASEAVEKALEEKEKSPITPVAAFITFEDEEGVARALRVSAALHESSPPCIRPVQTTIVFLVVCSQEYPQLGLLQSWFLPEHLFFQERGILLSKAEEPASILWQNLVTAREKPYVILRRMMTVVVALLALLISFSLIYKVGVKQSSKTPEYPGLMPSWLVCSAGSAGAGEAGPPLPGG
jgi:hypothetical protein